MIFRTSDLQPGGPFALPVALVPPASYAPPTISGFLTEGASGWIAQAACDLARAKLHEEACKKPDEPSPGLGERLRQQVTFSGAADKTELDLTKEVVDEPLSALTASVLDSDSETQAFAQAASFTLGYLTQVIKPSFSLALNVRSARGTGGFKPGRNAAAPTRTLADASSARRKAYVQQRRSQRAQEDASQELKRRTDEVDRLKIETPQDPAAFGAAEDAQVRQRQAVATLRADVTNDTKTAQDAKAAQDAAKAEYRKAPAAAEEAQAAQEEQPGELIELLATTAGTSQEAYMHWRNAEPVEAMRSLRDLLVELVVNKELIGRLLFGNSWKEFLTTAVQARVIQFVGSFLPGPVGGAVALAGTFDFFSGAYGTTQSVTNFFTTLVRGPRRRDFDAVRDNRLRGTTAVDSVTLAGTKLTLGRDLYREARLYSVIPLLGEGVLLLPRAQLQDRKFVLANGKSFGEGFDVSVLGRAEDLVQDAPALRGALQPFVLVESLTPAGTGHAVLGPAPAVGVEVSLRRFGGELADLQGATAASLNEGVPAKVLEHEKLSGNRVVAYWLQVPGLRPANEPRYVGGQVMVKPPAGGADALSELVGVVVRQVGDRVLVVARGLVQLAEDQVEAKGKGKGKKPGKKGP